MVGVSVYEHVGWGLRVRVLQGVHPREDWWVRCLEVEDLTGAGREVRVMQSQELRVNETDIGDTALYHSPSESIAFFKGNVWILLAGRGDSGRLVQVATGLSGVMGLEGTWRDAEDGELHGKPIEQGSVDAAWRVDVRVPGGGVGRVWAPVVFGTVLEEAEASLGRLEALGYAAALDECRAGDAAWRSFSVREVLAAGKEEVDVAGAQKAGGKKRGLFRRAQAARVARLRERLADPRERGRVDSVDFSGLGSGVRQLVEHSVRVVRAHTGEMGQVVAAVDSDIMLYNRSNYAYVWMRDAALTGMTMRRLGDDRQVLMSLFLPESETGRFLWQKYDLRGRRASTWHPWADTGEGWFPYQEDQTALLVWFLAEYLGSHGGAEGRVREAIDGWADLLAGHVDETGLAKPSWDLWEERFGVHLWTLGTVVRALRAVAGLEWGSARARRLADVAERMAARAVELFGGETERVPRRVTSGGALDWTADASTLAGSMMVPEWRDSLFGPARAMVESRLLLGTASGGVARYEGDYYCRVREGYAGNAWVICTMWWARSALVAGKGSRDGRAAGRAEAGRWLEWAAGLATPTLLLSEQYHPDTGEPLSVMPLTWSHAEVIETALDVVSG